MPFTIPTFPLLCTIYDNTNTAIYNQRLGNVPCNLSPGKRVMLNTGTAGGSWIPLGGQQMTMELLLPKGTDLHNAINGFFPDVIEVPATSGRFYALLWFDDVGKGFTNEYRLATMVACCSATGALVPFLGGIPDWPVPVP